MNMESLKSLRLEKWAIHIFTKKNAVIHMYFDVKIGAIHISGRVENGSYTGRASY